MSLLSLIMLSACGMNSNKERTQVKENIQTIIKDESKNEIDVTAVTDFDWDKAYLFTPYTTREQIEETIDATFWANTTIDTNDSIYLLVYMYKDTVTQFIEIPRLGNDFKTETKIITKENPMIAIIR